MINPMSEPAIALAALCAIRRRLERGEEFETMTGNALRFTLEAIEQAEKLKAMLPADMGEAYLNASKGGP